MQTIDYNYIYLINCLDIIILNFITYKDDKTYMKSIVNTSFIIIVEVFIIGGIYDIFKNKECMKSEDLIIHHYFLNQNMNGLEVYQKGEKSIEESKKYKNLFLKDVFNQTNDNKNRLIVNKTYRNPHMNDSNKDYNDNMKKYCSKDKKRNRFDILWKRLHQLC